MAGWIKLHRKMLDNPVVCKDSDYLAVWVYLLLNATHENYPALFKGKKIILKPGQLIIGRKNISMKLYISESKVQRILNLLKNEQQIEQQTSNHNRLITIVNWLEYQNSEQQIEQPVNNQRTTSEQPVNTNKNVKNIKNIIPPDIKDVIAYCSEREKGVDAHKWYDFYSSKGWMIGKNKMVDWQSAVRTWEQKTEKPKTTKTVELPDWAKEGQ